MTMKQSIAAAPRVTPHTEAGYEVRIFAARHGVFTDLRDAIEAARIVKREHPLAIVGVYKPDGQMVMAAEL
jgi:hypothetical protein